MKKRQKTAADGAVIPERLKSIVACQALAFDSSITGLRTGVTAEYRELLDFDENPTPDKADRLVSIVKAHTAMFGAGLINPNAAVRAEEAVLLRYIEAKAADAPEPRRAAILPRNLGAAFVRKGYGWPLFGYLRPPVPPKAAGILLCYQGIEADGAAHFRAAALDGDAELRYDGLGVRINATAAWLRAVIVSDSCSETAAVRALGRGAAATAGEPTRIGFHRYELAIAPAKGLPPKMETEFTMDPFSYQYAYLFRPDDDVGRTLAKYLSDVWNGSFGLSERDAEAAAELFIRRLL